MLITHVISSDIVMTERAVQNAAVNIVVRGKKKTKPKSQPVILNASSHHGRDADSLQTPSTFLSSSWKLAEFQSRSKQADETISLYVVQLYFLLLFPIIFSFWRVTPLKSLSGESLGFPPCLPGLFLSLVAWGTVILHSHPAKSWVLTGDLVIFECCRFAVLFWGVICQFHYKPHL